uniref:Uncharacterized protein n=1 Tax=Arundo donax TaxID=35708 RepID=A0A0A9CST7_ARUDO
MYQPPLRCHCSSYRPKTTGHCACFPCHQPPKYCSCISNSLTPPSTRRSTEPSSGAPPPHPLQGAHPCPSARTRPRASSPTLTAASRQRGGCRHGNAGSVTTPTCPNPSAATQHGRPRRRPR